MAMRSKSARFLDEQCLQRVARRLVVLGARRRWPAATALGWVLLTRPVKVDGTRQRRTRGRRFVALYKLGGLEDLVATLARRGTIDVGLARLQRDDIKLVFGEFVQAPLDDFDYRPHDTTLDDAKNAYRSFLARVCRHYRRWLGVGALVAANFGYAAERELAGAASDVGLPFLALHKESIRTPGQRPRYEASLRDNVGRFTGHSIAVYNAAEKSSLVRAGVARADHISVTGCPRLDDAHRLRELPAPEQARTKIVYFAIDPVAGTRTFAADEVVRGTPAGDATTAQPVRWDALTRLLERELVAVARERPHIDFVVKIKLGRRPQVRARFEGSDLPPNVTLTGGGLAPKHIASARAVIGLNTTALLEALAAGRHVLVPHFAEASMPANERFLFELGDAVHTLTDPRARHGDR